ncbi:MAG: DUF3987 domain-containing protein [Planctomycetota bacterium]
MTRNGIIDAARAYLAAGQCVLPARRDQKRPVVGQWKQYRLRRPTQAELEAWMANGPDALCILCGRISGNGEMIDFDAGGELFEAWASQIPADLLAKLVIETTQRDGRHVHYRCESEVCGNLKLAQRREGENVVTLIETRGEGGLFLCAPTPGYELIQGDLARPPVITEAERDILLQAAWELNEYVPAVVEGPLTCGPVREAGTGDRPGDDFNRRGDVRAVLERHGWTRVGGGENEYWQRPGKSQGWSATLKGGVFYVFSSNAAPFEPNQPYSPFAVLAYLEHGGDFAAATRALSAEGFGSLPEGQAADDDGVDLSHILGWAEQTETAAEGIPDPGPIPDELFEVPGFVGEVMDFCLATAPYPNRGLAFCGAMALQSFLAGRKVVEPGDLRPNIYLLALAGSGAGKDHPRKLNARVLFEAGLIECLGDKFASGEGIQDAMALTPCMLFQNDEMDSVLRQINRDKEGTRESIPATLLTMYTTAGSVFPLRRKAGKEQAGIIDQPSLTLFGTATPKYFYESLSEQMLTNGFFARLMIVDIGRRGDGQRPGSLRSLPERITATARWWANFMPGQQSGHGNLASFHPEPAVVPIRDDAALLLDDFREVTEREYREGEERGDEVWKAVWARGYENAAKMALLRACSSDHVRPMIDLPTVEWAIRFSDHQIRRQLFLASEHVYGNEFEDLCKQMLRVLREWQARHGEGWMPFWRVSRKLKWSPKQHVEVRQALIDSREIEYQESTTGGRPSRQYRLLPASCSAARKKP